MKVRTLKTGKARSRRAWRARVERDWTPNPAALLNRPQQLWVSSITTLSDVEFPVPPAWSTPVVMRDPL